MQGLMLLCDDFFQSGFQVLLIPKLCEESPFFGGVGGSAAASLLRSAPQQQMVFLYEAAGLGPPLSCSLPISHVQRGYVSVIIISVSFPVQCVCAIQKLPGRLAVSKYRYRCPAVIRLPSPDAVAAAASLTSESKRAIRQLPCIPLALCTFQLLFKDHRVMKRVPGGSALIPCPFCSPFVGSPHLDASTPPTARELN